MTTVFIPWQIWMAGDQAGCDGPGSCRDFTIGVRDGRIVSVVMREPFWGDDIAYDERQFRGMVGVGNWPAVLDRILELAEKQAELPPDWRNAG